MVLSEKMVKRHLSALSKRYPSKEVTSGVLITLLIFSVGMITLPFTAYYIFSYLSNGSSVFGAAAAIITAHVILGIFLYKAIRAPVAELELKEE